MIIPIQMSVSVSKKFTSTKSGQPKSFNKLQGTVLGLGICEILVPAEKIPDEVEGKTIKAELELYVGRDFSIRLGFKRLVGYAE